jgi:hypothetical protein
MPQHSSNEMAAGFVWEFGIFAELKKAASTINAAVVLCKRAVVTVLCSTCSPEDHLDAEGGRLLA